MSTRDDRRRWTRAKVTVGFVALLLVVSAGLAVVLRFNPGGIAEANQDPPSANGDGARAQTVDVEASGFTATIDGVQVEGPAGVAPPGTSVEVRAEDNATGDLDGFATPLPGGVAVELGDGLQPQAPITVTFSGLSESSAPDVVTAVAASRPDGGVELADAEWEGDDLVVTTSHLSWFQPIEASIQGFGDWFADELQKVIGLRSEEPDCFSEPVLDGDWAFEPVEAELSWPCAESDEDGGEVTVELQNNSPGVWQVTIDQPNAQPLFPNPTSTTEIPIAALSGKIRGREDALVMGPTTTVGWQMPEPGDTVTMSVSNDLILTSANGGLAALAAFLPDEGFRALKNGVGWTDCARDVGTSVPDGDGADGEVFTAVLGCFGTAIGGTVGAIIGGFTSLPGLATGTLDAQMRLLFGYQDYEVTMTELGSTASVGDLTGTWRGEVRQTLAGDYPAVLTFDDDSETGATGGTVGRVRYPELAPCEGDLTDLRAEEDGSFTVREIIDQPSECVDTTIRLTFDEPGRLFYFVKWRTYTVEGTLRRVDEDAPEIPKAPVEWPTSRWDGPTDKILRWARDNLYNRPRWIACDDEVKWCLMDGRESHEIIKLGGDGDIEAAGGVNDFDRERMEGLANWDVPYDSSRQILGLD